jgi:hypothetical protein
MWLLVLIFSSARHWHWASVYTQPTAFGQFTISDLLWFTSRVFSLCTNPHGPISQKIWFFITSAVRAPNGAEHLFRLTAGQALHCWSLSRVLGDVCQDCPRTAKCTKLGRTDRVRYEEDGSPLVSLRTAFRLGSPAADLWLHNGEDPSQCANTVRGGTSHPWANIYALMTAEWCSGTWDSLLSPRVNKNWSIGLSTKLVQIQFVACRCGFLYACFTFVHKSKHLLACPWEGAVKGSRW